MRSCRLSKSCRRQPNFSMPMDTRSASRRLSRTGPLMALSLMICSTSFGKGVVATQRATCSTVHSLSRDGGALALPSCMPSWKASIRAAAVPISKCTSTPPLLAPGTADCGDINVETTAVQSVSISPGLGTSSGLRGKFSDKLPDVLTAAFPDAVSSVALGSISAKETQSLPYRSSRLEVDISCSRSAQV